MTLCHATSSQKNPWVVITIAPDGSANGHAGSHHQSGRDIIPAFDYTVNKVVKHFPGQNWDAAGQAIWAAGCSQPPPQADPAPTVNLTAGECVAKATYPPVTAVFGGLVAGQPYSYRVNGGAAVNFTAGSDSQTVALGTAPGVTVTVEVWGTGTRAASGKITGTLDVVKCLPPLEVNVTLCHATGSDSNEWQELTLPAAGVISGHAGESHQDGRDVIPAFEYELDGATLQFAGQNLDEAGLELLANSCASTIPEADPPPTVSLDVAECSVEEDQTSVSATFGDLVVGQPYSYSVNGGAAESFTAGSSSETKDLGAEPGTTITVAVWGTGPRSEPGTVSTSADVPRCDEPADADVTLCHATESEQNPWVELTLPPEGAYNGHAGPDHHDADDIIPAFSFEKDGVTINFPGQNMGDGGAEILANHCEELPPVVDPTPTISVTVGECPVEGGFSPVTVSLSDLVIGQPYRVDLDGVSVEESSPIEFVADATTKSIPISPTEEGGLLVTVQGTGENAGESAEATVQVEECPEPELPTLTLAVDQCTAYGTPLPNSLSATLGALVDGVDYTVTIAASGGGVPYSTRNVHGGESATEVLDFDIAGSGTYTVTATVGEESVTAEITVEPCPAGEYDLSLVKSATAGEDGIAEVGDTIHYTLAVANAGPDAAQDPVVTDTLPAGLVPVAGSESADGGWSVAFAGSTVTASYSGAFSGEASISFDVTVTEAPASGEITNTACVAASGPALPSPERSAAAALAPSSGLGTVAAESPLTAILAGDEVPGGGDTNSGNDCGSTTTTVRAVAVAGAAVCIADVPWFTYDITPSGIGDTADLPIVMIWWTAEAFANRDPSIPASDIAAILADGAAQVDPIAYPAGWQSGDAVTGQMLWPGATIDAEGNPTGWPGWTQKSDGTWVLDPTAPHYDLRAAAVVEIRINPTASETTVYPPATPNCAAQPPENPPVTPPVTPPATPPTVPGAVVPGAVPGAVPAAVAPAAAPVHAELARTGAGANLLGGAGIGLVLLGAAVWSLTRRRRETV